MKRLNGLVTKEKSRAMRNSNVSTDVSIRNKIYFRATLRSDARLAWLAQQLLPVLQLFPDLINVSDTTTFSLNYNAKASRFSTLPDIKRHESTFSISSTFHLSFCLSCRLPGGRVRTAYTSQKLLSIIDPDQSKTFACGSSPKNSTKFLSCQINPRNYSIPTTNYRASFGSHADQLYKLKYMEERRITNIVFLNFFWNSQLLMLWCDEISILRYINDYKWKIQSNVPRLLWKNTCL